MSVDTLHKGDTDDDDDNDDNNNNNNNNNCKAERRKFTQMIIKNPNRFLELKVHTQYET
jgi:hypothetical protein